MTTTITTHLRDLCTNLFGFEHPTTIEVFQLLEDGFECLALETFCQATLALLRPEADEDEGEDFPDEVDEAGFDPYEGAYTWDC